MESGPGNGSNAIIYPNPAAIQFNQGMNMIRPTNAAATAANQQAQHQQQQQQHVLQQASLMPLGRMNQSNLIPFYSTGPGFAPVGSNFYLSQPSAGMHILHHPHHHHPSASAGAGGVLPVASAAVAAAAPPDMMSHSSGIGLSDNFSNPSAAISPASILSTAHSVSGTTFYRRSSDDLPGDPREPLYQELQMEEFRNKYFPDQLPPRDGVLSDGQCFSSLAISPGRSKVFLFPSKDHYIAHYCNYYFSKENLTKDIHTLSKLKQNSGFLKLSELGQFPKLVSVGASELDIENALMQSGRVDVVTLSNSERCVRRKDLWLPSSESTASSLLGPPGSFSSGSEIPSIDSIGLMSPSAAAGGGGPMNGGAFTPVLLNPLSSQMTIPINFHPNAAAYTSLQAARFPITSLPPNAVPWQFQAGAAAGISPHFTPGQANVNMGGLASPVSNSVNSGTNWVYTTPHPIQYANAGYASVTQIPSLTGQNNPTNVVGGASTGNGAVGAGGQNIWPLHFSPHYVNVNSNPIAQPLHVASSSSLSSTNPAETITPHHSILTPSSSQTVATAAAATAASITTINNTPVLGSSSHNIPPTSSPSSLTNT